MPKTLETYRGRFAPSPTGPLHLGSLLAAVASFADARAHGGTWLVRIEDLDRARAVPGSAPAILNTLDAFGLHWDDEVLYQSERTGAYADALAALAALDLTYPCGCSRTEIAGAANRGLEGPIYPGTCRLGLPQGRVARAERFVVRPGRIRFNDRIQGPQEQQVREAVGDFVLRRADGLHAYQLAVVVDDAWQDITHIVRGADLLLSTPRQIMLQRALECDQPHYAHVPLVLDATGRKLSKSLAAAPVNAHDPLPALRLVWTLLGQDQPPADLGADMFWDWAIPRWRTDAVPSRASVEIDTAGTNALSGADNSHLPIAAPAHPIQDCQPYCCVNDRK